VCCLSRCRVLALTPDGIGELGHATRSTPAQDGTRHRLPRGAVGRRVNVPVRPPIRQIQCAPPVRTPDLIVPLESGDVGEVWESDAAVVRVPIRNTTDRAIRINHLSTDCRAKQIEPRACAVPPHGEVTVAVTLDLADRRLAEFGLLSRRFSFRLAATVEGRTGSIRLPVAGTCRSRVAVSTPVVNFGEANVAGRPPVSRSVTVRLSDPADLLGASSSSDLIRVVGRREPNGGIQLVITPDTNRLRGDFSGTVQVDAIGPDGRAKGSTTIAVEGTVRVQEPSRRVTRESQP
jgi:hypothetical protein